MPNYFELYGMPASFHPDLARVKDRYYDISRQYHPDRFATGDASALEHSLQMSSMNNAAYKTLRDPDATMAYILRIVGLLEDEEKYTLPPAFLMEMMDLNEAVSDYEADTTNTDARDMAVNNLNEQLELWNDATALLTSRFDGGEHTRDLLLLIKDQYFRKKYLLRIKERIDKFAAP